MHPEPLVTLTAILVAGVLAQWLAWKTRLPAIVFLLTFGLLAGPVSGLLRPDALFGELLFPMISLAVAVILFEGALTLRLEQLRGVERVVRNLVSVGALVTGGIMALAARWLVGLDWGLALLFGALVVVTGPTVVVPMLRSVRPTQRVASVLRWEGIVIDPLGALLAVVVFEALISSYLGESGDAIWLVFGRTVATGAVLGALAGFSLARVIGRHRLPDYLHNVVTLAAVLAVFALADRLAPESGLLAVTVMGMLMANSGHAAMEEILDFKESLSLVLISVLFITLAARLDLARLADLAVPIAALLGVMMLLARPLAVAVSSIGSDLGWRERALVAWIGPRGIVAAAISAVFALRLEEAGIEQAPLIVPLTFGIILGTVLVQGATAAPLARWLGVAEPEPRGVLIVGANPVARALGGALREHGFPVLLCDTNWEAVRAARMDGLPAFYGSPVSEHADRHLDLVGLGRLLALSSSDQMNALACIRYATEFGRGRVYSLASRADGDGRSAGSVARQPGYRLFGEDVSYAKLASLLAQGAEIRGTRLTEEFDWDAYREKYGERAIPLAGITPEKRLRPFVVDHEPELGADWIVLGLVRDAAEESERQARSEGAARKREAARGD